MAATHVGHPGAGPQLFLHAVEGRDPLRREVGLGLGAQAGEGRLRQVFEEAGFTRFRRATESALNLILEARP